MKPLARLDFMARAPRPWVGLLLCTFAAGLMAAAAASAWQLERDNRDRLALVNERAARLLPPPPRKLTEAERDLVARTVIRAVKPRTADRRPHGNASRQARRHSREATGSPFMQAKTRRGAD